ncbi:hypothetical protein [Lysobacter sp. Root983]|uniref:hypothetical protein n=1 Tax=Lysobacter sp. Root983 TaxID=1736613 RepID=UPI0012FA94BA|nr:hypothetical protein [Lysobacter sp. Root983]
MDPMLWNLFHDGVLTRAEGAVPGEVRLFIDIPYLRAKFPGKGAGFDVVLSECSKLSLVMRGGSVIALADIRYIKPEILSAEPGPPLKIFCEGGTLTLQYRSVELFVDSGAPITLQELDAASEAYWTEWEAGAHRDG